ncbi:DEP domain-containing protein 1A-like isoform X1 [Myxocyprinus asiaticus]|uniref:DEP domain-containing protein 1A-like isoform X1 n=1 Tax=Myxocyprinus asiaticus TaxID=70543 RepID=UPI002222A8B0|nr:DEP domain-containing protein 1A-like isoform X1 [Myxocyprinus asiaticus]XP_051525745.1 DEP domain-containing protein 1A-like isoform X1 [Myxocyprinus asiaticus]
MSSHVVTPGPYRATKLWNEVTKLFRAGMPLKKHRLHFRVYMNCFTASAAVDWLHELLKINSNFGPEVTRQQTVQLLKKFLKNYVIEDVKGRRGMEDLEDNSQLYRFPSTSPRKTIPNCAPVLRKKSISMMDKEGFFKFRGSKKFNKKVLENVDPEMQESPTESALGETKRCRELTEEDIQVIWKNVTLTHLQKLLGSGSLDDVLDPAQVNPQFIVYNMMKVNKHGVVSLEDKKEDLPHWVLSAMKCLANWPKYNSNQPSYPGFERDVFKTVSCYFYSLSQPLLTYQYYELFVNILVMCGYITTPKTQCGKRKNQDDPNCPQQAKAPHLNVVNLFKSTECLLMSLIRKEAFDEAESPMREVYSSKAETKIEVQRAQQPVFRGRRASAGVGLEGSYLEAPVGRLHPRSCSLERIVDNVVVSCSKSNLFPSSESLQSCGSNKSTPHTDSPVAANLQGSSMSINSCPGVSDTKFQNAQTSSSSTSHQLPSDLRRANPRPSRARPRSIGNLFDIEKNGEMCASMRPDCSSSVDLRAPGLVRMHGSCMDVRASPSISRCCQSSMDLSKPAPAQPSLALLARCLSPVQSLLQPSLERVAIEALQLCTLLLPPASRRKLQLLLRMISRMSQNMDMPRLHDIIGTRTLLVQTFNRCVLSCEEVDDLDELLATRLLLFLMDHHQEVMQVPVYLRNAVEDHVSYLKSLNTCPGPGVVMPTYSFCRQISTQEFEEHKLSVSQAALTDLLENLINDKSMSVKEKKQKLELFQKEYPDIYLKRFPTMESEAQLFADKPKIKPPMLLSIKKPNVFSIRN